MGELRTVSEEFSAGDLVRIFKIFIQNGRHKIHNFNHFLVVTLFLSFQITVIFEVFINFVKFVISGDFF